MRTFIRKAHGSVRRDRALLVNHVLILANTGIRVGEAINLKWRDIRPITTADGTETVAMVVRGKTGMREVVTRTSDVKKWFNSILTERKTDLGDEGSDLRNARAVRPDSFVFCGRDGSPIGSFKKSFAALLNDAGVEFDAFGNKRTSIPCVIPTRRFDYTKGATSMRSLETWARRSRCWSNFTVTPQTSSLSTN